LIGLLVCRLPFGLIMTGIGVISLAGVVVNNAIVLLAYTRQLQKETAATTILGLIPMATGVSFDFRNLQWETASMSSQWWNNMATAVIFGLGFATLLTLVFVPVVYVSLYRLGRKLGFDSLGLTSQAVEETRLEFAENRREEADRADIV